MKKVNFKRVAVILFIIVMGMSLFACKPKEKVEKIEIPLEQSVNSNETKAQETKELVIEKPIETKPIETQPVETKPAETKPTENSENTPISDSQSEYLDKWWAEQQKKNQEPKPETDAMGRPYLQKGQDFTFKDNGMGEPNEAPYSGITAVNPNTGVKYRYNTVNGWHVDTKEEDDEKARLIMEEDYVTNSEGKLVKGRKLTEEEAREIAKMYSNSFK